MRDMKATPHRSSVDRTSTFSELLRHPNDVIAQLDQGDVTITRREGDTLVLSKANRRAENLEMLDQLSQLIAASLDDAACDRMAARLEDQYPWVSVLPEGPRRMFVGEFFRVLRGSVKVGGFAQMSGLLLSWEATAEAYAKGFPQPEFDPDFAGTADAVVARPGE